MRIQRRNATRDDLINADRHMSEILSVSIGRLNVYNGQFTEGGVASSPFPDGWELWPNAGQTIVRTNADSIAGAHCIQGTVDAIGGTAPGFLLQQRLMPVSTLTTYVLRVSMRASGAGITCRWGMACFNAAKVFSAIVIAYAANPGINWVQNTQNMGFAGTAFVAGTRWVRFYFDWDDVTANSYVRVDNIMVEM